MTQSRFLLVCVATCAMAMAGLSCGQEGSPPPGAKGEANSIHLLSSAFLPGGPIPARYTSDGQDASPPLAWEGVPPGTKELALICDDPDAPQKEPWVHWVLAKIPAGAKELNEGGWKTLDKNEDVPLVVGAKGLRVGKNDFGNKRYNGPMPPPGKVHHYFFRLYALDTQLDLKDAPTKGELITAMKGHILAVGELIGTYEKGR